jgi:predicted TIM-barrel fold metal-dependent hydrolase
LEVTQKVDTEVAMCRSWNRWLADNYRRSDGRLRWVCCPPTLSIKDSIEQIRYSKEHGAVGVYLRPFEHHEKLPTDPYFYPIYEEAERQNMPMCMHIANANRPYVEFVTTQRTFDANVNPAAFSIFYAPLAIATHAVILSEIHDLFPKLRWGVVEAGCSWLPWLMRDMKERYKRAGKVVPHDLLAQKNIFVTAENDDDIGYVISQVGEDCLMLGTDYGHPDAASDVQAMRTLRERSDISDSAKQKLISDNARRLYAL